jgi:hypothetical protein
MMLLAVTFLKTNSVKAQNLSATLSPSNYSEFNISCHGANDGQINVSVTGGTAPYTYLWNNGSTVQNRTGLSAGNYSVTITDFVHTSITKTIVLKEPKAIIVALNSPEFEGNVNISSHGQYDGTIDITVTGGNPPYRYQWSNGSVEARQSNLTAGTYSVTVTDDNNCTQSSSITLTEPGTMQISNIVKSVFGSYNVGCSYAENGSITLTISGGVAPYEFDWSNGAMTKDIQNVGAAEYHVRVTDRNGTEVSTAITLTAPPDLSVSLTPSIFTAPYNISCVGCSDGSISSATSGGIAPYTYSWNTGQTTANINNVSGGVYVLTVADANGCSTIQAQELVSPPQDGWNRYGNAATNPATQFIGTTDNTDMVIKTNNTEAIHIKADGKIGIGTSNPADKFTIYDAQNASIRLSEQKGDSTINFDIGFLKDSILNGKVGEGAVVIGTTGGGKPNASTHNFAASAGMTNMINNSTQGFVKNPCSDVASLPSMIFDAPSFTWFIPTCPPTADSLAMALDNAGNLFVKGNGWFAGSLQSEGLRVNNHNNKFAAVIANYGTNGKGLMIQGGNGSNATANYSLLEISDMNSYKILSVNGKDGITYARGIKVQTTAFPDYVFNADYKLTSLKELESYIAANHHLPQMPTATEAETNGVNIGDMQNKLLQKIEELTLYLVQQQKEIDALKKQIATNK